VFAIVCMVAILWVIYGYSLAFTGGGPVNDYVGGFSKIFLMGVTPESTVATFSNGVVIPELVYICFQMTFACITPALIVGGFAERMKFSALMLFIGLWVTFVCFPIAHMVWYWAGPDALAEAATKLAQAADGAAKTEAQKALERFPADMSRDSRHGAPAWRSNKSLSSYVIPAPLASEASKRDKAGTHAPQGNCLRSAFAPRDVRGAVADLAGARIEQIDPLGVHALDQPDLPLPAPLLDPVLASYGLRHQVMHLVVDEHVHMVVLGEALDETLLVLGHADVEIARHARVDRAVALARQDVHGWRLLSIRHDDPPTQEQACTMPHDPSGEQAWTCMGPGLVPLVPFGHSRRRDDVGGGGRQRAPLPTHIKWKAL